MRRAHGFTLIELMVVITIVGLVSVVVLPGVISAVRERPVLGATQLIQASIAGARDLATRTGQPQGIRLAPDRLPPRLADGTIDPAEILYCSRIVPLTTPGPYAEGAVSIYPSQVYPVALTGGRPCLVLEQSPGRWVASGTTYAWQPNAPTSWGWNVRCGERVSISGGAEYVVCGPMAVLPGNGNAEQFVNYGPTGTSGFVRTYTSPDGGQSVDLQPDVLLLVNGRDDDGDGYVDNGWDGINNDVSTDGLIDELTEWESETWHSPQARGVIDRPYRIVRRPVAVPGPRAVVLPSNAVIDLTGWDLADPRSRVELNPHTGNVDILISPTGGWTYGLPYATPSNLGMLSTSYVHLWVGSRSDLAGPASPPTLPNDDAWLVTLGRQGAATSMQIDATDLPKNYRDARQGVR